ncbi:hypothetical protein TYRP_023694 [Tyrophagus putrescentiae]|nr:hypothetical protein TYRP_023694 [Tyrophagus putrescentiae]
MSSTWYFLAILAAILGSFIGPSQSTVIPLTNQPLTSSQSFSAAAAVHSQVHAPSVGNSRSNVNPFPAHDPFGRAKVYPGMVPHYPQENGGGQKRQTLQFTFSPEPQQQQQQQQPLPIIKAVYTPPEALLPGPGGAPAADRSQMIINPADIQWTAPDVPDAISSEIINKIRLQLGNGPVTLGELNHRLIQFTTTLPNVLVNKTQITTVQETVVEEQKQVQQEDQKSTRMMTYQQQQQQQPKKPVSASYKVTTTSSSTSTSGYDGHPSKTYVSYDKVTPPINSLSYNPAAVYDSSRSAVPPYMAGNDYQKSYSEQQYSYQVPSESSYQTNYYQPQSQPQPQPQLSRRTANRKCPAAYQKAPEPAYASKPQQQQQQYQPPPPPPPKAADYQKPKAEAYQQQPPPPKESYSAPPPPHHQQHKKQQSYTSPPPPPPPPKEENVKIIYKYVEVCNPSSYEKLQPQSPPPPPPQPSYKPQQPKPQYPNQQGQQKPNPYVEVAGSLASQYPNSGEPLNLDLASTTSEAAGSAQDSQAALASVYGEIHRRMAELEQLQRYVASVQAEVQQAYSPIVIPQIYVPPMPTLSYSSVGPSYLEPQVPSTYYSPAPAPNYPPPPPPPPPPPKPAAASYSPPPPKQQEYKPQQQQPSYSTPKPQPVSYNTPKPSYNEPQPQQQQSYNSGQPYNGNQMTVQYVKTVEKVSQNATSPAAAAAAAY